MNLVVLQVGMHGAGLINHNFMRPNTSFIEILPCLFGGEWHDQSFQVPSKKDNIIFAWKIQAYNPIHCHPSRLESHTYRPGRHRHAHTHAQTHIISCAFYYCRSSLAFRLKVAISAVSIHASNLCQLNLFMLCDVESFQACWLNTSTIESTSCQVWL